MEKKFVQNINRKVYAQFPEMDGQSPRIERRNTPGEKTIGKKQTYSLTYDTVSRNAKGRRFPRRVRVVADNKGKIIKISTSR